MNYTTTVDINAARATVWAILVDVERWPIWTKSMTSIEIEGTDSLTLGTSVQVVQPKLAPAVFTVTALKPGEEFTWDSSRPGVSTVATHQISGPTDGPVTVSLGIAMTGPLAGPIRLAFGRLVRKYVEMEAAGLKARAEAR